MMVMAKNNSHPWASELPEAIANVLKARRVDLPANPETFARTIAAIKSSGAETPQVLCSLIDEQGFEGLSPLASKALKKVMASYVRAPLKRRKH